MKLTKKIIALLLAMALVFCFVACGDPEPAECTSHVDANGDGICDNEGCGAPVEAKGEYVPVPVNPTQATAYVNAIWGAVENAKTITVSINMSSTVGKGDSVDESGAVISGAAEDKMSVGFAVTLAASENGVDLKVEGVSDMDGNKSYMEAFIVDGMAYMRTTDYEGNWTEWDAAEIVLPAEMTSTIEQVMAIIASYVPADFEITPEMIAEAKAAIAEAVTALMTVNEDGSFGAKLDAKPIVDSVAGFIGAIDPNASAASFINSVLALVDEELTVEAILDGAGEYGAVTLGDIYTAVSEAIFEETGMTVQQIKDAIFADEQITGILVANGALTAEMLEEIKAMNVDEMVAAYAEMTLDDVVYMMMMSNANPEASPVDEGGAEDEVDTTGMLAAMAAEIKGMLTQMTVLQMAGEGFDTFVEVMKSVKVNSLYAYLNIKLGADLSFGAIEIGFKEDMALTIPTYEFVGDNSDPVACTAEQYMVTEFTFTITSISMNTTVIEAPAVA